MGRIFLVLGTATILVLSFPWEKTTEYSHLTVGSVVTKEIIAPFDFEVLKNPAELEEERLAARQSVNPVFVRSDSVQRTEIQAFDQLWARVHRISNSVDLRSASPATLAAALRDSLKDVPFLSFQLPAWESLGQIARRPTSSRAFMTAIRQVLIDIYSKAILGESPQSVQVPSGEIAVVDQGVESLVPADQFFAIESARADALGRMKSSLTESFTWKWESSLPSADTTQTFDTLRIAYRLVLPFLSPNLLFDSVETETRQDRAVSQVPTVKGLVLKNERIVDSNVRLTQDYLDKLRSLEIKEAELAHGEGGFQQIGPIAGRAALVLGLLLLMGGILEYLGYGIYREIRHLLTISVLLILPVISASLLIHQTNLSIVYLPISCVVMVTSFLFGMSVAVGFAIVASALVAAVVGFDFSVFILMLFPSLVSVLAVQRAQTRTRIMKAAIPIGIIYLLTIALLQLLRYSFEVGLWHELAIGAVNAIVSPVLAMGLLIIFEQFSGITTDLTLLELGDLNRPLLRRLALEAPGTYHHSIVVGNLSEAAAEAIGANPLLVRVAAYYHDIGKIENKEYFIENQENGTNVHDLISPEMSASVLRDHVAHGLALAKKYRIPKAVSDFIPQHHGRSLMMYFYHKALKQSKNKKVDPDLYRYPGPDPMSREAGILMLADMVEAISKSLKNPDADEIKNAIDQAVDSRVKEGELDDSDLTLNDIKQIKEAFAHVISGTVHPRIEYPTGTELEQAQAATDKDVSPPLQKTEN